LEENNPDSLSNVTVRLEGKENAEAICNMLRGLLLASRVVELKGITNSRLLRGLTFSFGDAAIAQKFVTDVETLFSRRVRERLEIALHD
jgi:pyruvate-formate lyase-activating enzyme